jgi:DNA polymerase-3 subunit alpha
MSKGDTAGIFQFEGDGISDAIRQIRPTCFADITAINALYRPGPMDMIPEFAKRKNGESEVEYIFDELKPSLEETYGIIVYQEQVMAIASAIAGYSLGEADMLRRAMGKKIKEEMDQQRVRFLKGASEKGFDSKKSNELFDLMYKFADYGFNKSHAAAYCVVAAQTAWLKCYYPAEFFAALLSTEMSDTDKVVKYVKDVQKHGVRVQVPHVNYSEYNFTVHGDTIYFSLGAIKGVGESAVEAIIEAREQLPDHKFESIEQFFEKVDLRRVNKKVIECLIKSGALDQFGAHRAQLYQCYSKILESVEVKRKDSEIGQRSLFDMIEEDAGNTKIILDKVKPWTRMVSLAFEKEVLGFYLSDHPLAGWDHITRMWTTCEIKNLKDIDTKVSPQPSPPANRRTRDWGKKRVLLDGLIAQFRELITKKGTRMAFATLEDLTGSVELVVFPDTYAKTEMYFKDEKPLLIGGLLESENGNFKIIVDSVITVEESLKKVKHLAFNVYKFNEEDMVKLQSLFIEYPGSTEISLQCDMPELNKRVIFEFKDENLKIQFSSDFLEGLNEHLGRTDFIELRG